MKLIIFIILIISFSKLANAEIGSVTGLELPRFISLKTNDANIRVGPSKNYPILIKYIKNNFPLEVIEEHDQWRKVRDFKNHIGWIHKSLISGKRTGILISKENYKIEIFNTTDGYIIGSIGYGNIVSIHKCKIDWCLISIENFKGWVSKKNIWGVNQNETFKLSYLQNIQDLYWLSINLLRRNFY